MADSLENMSTEIKAHKEETMREFLELKRKIAIDIKFIEDKTDKVANASEVV